MSSPLDALLQIPLHEGESHPLLDHRHHRRRGVQVRQCPPPGEREYSIFEPGVQEQGEKDKLTFLAQQERNKRQQSTQQMSNKRRTIGERETPSSKRQKGPEESGGRRVEVLTLEDSDEEPDKMISGRENTSRPETQLPATIRHTSVSNTNTSQSEIPAATKSVETPAAIDRLKSLPITVVGEVELSGTDSDDDIQVNVQNNNTLQQENILKTLLAGS